MLGIISYNYCNEIIGRARGRLHTYVSGGEKCGEVKQRVSGKSKGDLDWVLYGSYSMASVIGTILKRILSELLN